MAVVFAVIDKVEVDYLITGAPFKQLTIFTEPPVISPEVISKTKDLSLELVEVTAKFLSNPNQIDEDRAWVTLGEGMVVNAYLHEKKVAFNWKPVVIDEKLAYVPVIEIVSKDAFYPDELILFSMALYSELNPNTPVVMPHPNAEEIVITELPVIDKEGKSDEVIFICYREELLQHLDKTVKACSGI